VERKRLQATYKQMARRDREAFLNKAASDAEEAASKGKMGDVFLAIRTVSGKTTSAVTAPIVKLDGSACSTTDEVLDRWREHYESALNHPAGSVCHELNDYAAAAQEDANVCTDEPTL